MLVDGFEVARQLFSRDPSAYAVLSEVPVPSHASGDKKVGRIDNLANGKGFPVLEHSSADPAAWRPENLVRVRWNNDDRDVMSGWRSAEQMWDWYRAAKIWSEMVRDERWESTRRLEPGAPLIFDNWRMLHGRRAFTGDRRVCGGYSKLWWLRMYGKSS